LEERDKVVDCILLGMVKGSSEILSAIEKQTSVKDLKDFILEEDSDYKKLK
jgi:hypothetical protein